MNMYKILGHDQKVYGPATSAQIRQWQAEGRINGATMLLLEGSNEWKPLSAIPEFSTPPSISLPTAYSTPTNGMASAGLTCGILSNVCCCLGFLFGILGIIFSAIALHRHDSNQARGGRGIALAGLILSVVGLIWHSAASLLFGLLPMGGTMISHRWNF